MIFLLQLVDHASVKTNETVIASIQKGFLALVGLEKNDNEKLGQKMLDKIFKLRVFPDEQGKMNLNLKDVNGSLLLVPQFTLMAETNKGNRPSFTNGMPPAEGQELFSRLLTIARENHAATHAGIFGADMKIDLCNNGPSTFYLKE